MAIATAATASRSLAELSDREDVDGRSQSELAALAKVVGVGAVKYADLSLNRESNYKFSYGKMLSLSGNTAPYMLYGYARMGSAVSVLDFVAFGMAPQTLLAPLAALSLCWNLLLAP